MLFSTPGTHYINRFLGAIVLLVSLACLNSYFFQAPWFQASQLCRLLGAVVPLVIIMPVGPLIFFYTRAIITPGWRIDKTHRRHFYPTIIDLVPYLAAIIYLIGYFLKMITPNPAPWALFIDNYNTYADIPRWLSISVYLYASYRLIQVNSGQNSTYKWLRSFILAFALFQFVWLCFMIPYLIPRYNTPLLEQVGWYPVMIPMVVLIYWMGIKGFLVFKTGDKNAYERATMRITPGIASQTLILLTRLMEEEHLYLKPDLNLEMVSKHIQLPPKTVSAVLNSQLHLSFNQWLNGYRVAAFKQRIIQANSGHLTLAGVASECGFNSQASFQRIFKQLTGMVPSEYRDSVTS
ncbi:helix-turn-helix transcriptional regulator [Mucilaginibacter lappiensis]|uniref:AraC-like DNA-binding protein n=1 Tax=Mucilaginibacter lappiensis TaxID=354630 RepID=A0A841JDW0_9SPHI|nr:AraC family transcriptional regulator [Mucilaginibacter lappiensis]MBB6129339.1 AraC-like DNA-binding protein [Mucilaginibacter lappiensis]